MSAFDALKELSGYVELDKDVVKSVCDAILADDSCDDEDKRRAALLAWSIDNGNNDSPDDVTDAGYGDNTYRLAPADYMVLTDEEADKAAADYIKDSVWAFNAGFLESATGIDSRVFVALADKCEDANDAILSLIEKTCGIDDFVKSAVAVDGRGHFMNTYDGSEDEYGDFLIYRVH